MNVLFRAITSSEDEEDDQEINSHRVDTHFYNNLNVSRQNVEKEEKKSDDEVGLKRKRNDYLGLGGEVNSQKIKFTFGKKKKKLKTVNLFEELLSDDSDLDEDTKKIEQLLEASTTDTQTTTETTYDSLVSRTSTINDRISFDDSFRPSNRFGYHFSSSSYSSSSYSNMRPEMTYNRDQHSVKPRPCDVNMLRDIGLYNTLACRSRRWMKARRRRFLSQKKKGNRDL